MCCSPPTIAVGGPKPCAGCNRPARAKDAFAIYASGIEQALSAPRKWLVGNRVSLADICFATELALFNNEHLRSRELGEHGLENILHRQVQEEYPRMTAHFNRLVAHEKVKPDIEPHMRKIRTAAAEALPSAATLVIVGEYTIELGEVRYAG